MKSMQESILIGLDIGSMSTKGVLLSTDGGILAEAAQEYGILQRQPGWMEQDPDGDWWQSTAAVIRSLLNQANRPPSQVAAICISGHFPSICLLDAEDRTLAPAMLYSDSRGGQLLAEAQQMVGIPLNGDEAILKLLWLRSQQLKLLRQTRRLCSTQGYVVYRLTGNNYIDYKTAAGFGGLWDADNADWKWDICRELQIADAAFPQVDSPVALAGRIRSQAAQEVGLAEGTPVMVGAPDTYAALLGHGALYAGEAFVSYGTTGYMAICKHNLVDMLHDPTLAGPGSPWFLGGYVLTVGAALNWYHEQFGLGYDARPDAAAYEQLDERCSQLMPGCEGLLALPYFQGQRTPKVDSHARGAFFGLTLSHTSLHLYRALLESYGFALQHWLKELMPQLTICRLIAGGQGAKSRLWRQVVSDILAIPQVYNPTPGSPLGSAFLAGYGVGAFRDFGAWRDLWFAQPAVTQPNAAAVATYERLFPVYAQLSESLDPLQSQLYQALTSDVSHGK